MLESSKFLLITVLKIWPQFRNVMIFLGLGFGLAASFEFFTITAVLGFISQLSTGVAPAPFKLLSEILHLDSSSNSLTFTTFIIAIILVNFIMRVLVLVIQNWTTQAVEKKLTLSLSWTHYRNGFFFNNIFGSSLIRKSLTQDVREVTSSFLGSILSIIPNIIFLVVIVFGSFIILGLPVLFIFSASAFTYAILLYSVARLNAKLGVRRNEANNQKFAVVDDFFSLGKQARVFGNFDWLVNDLDIALDKYNKVHIIISILNQAPRLILEAGVYCSLILVLSLFSSDSRSLELLVSYTFLFLKLIGVLQQIFLSITTIIVASPVVSYFSEFMKQVDAKSSDFEILEDSVEHPASEPLQFNTGLSMRWSDLVIDGRVVLHAGKIIIKAGEWTLVVGRSGSGKTTLIEGMLGLNDLVLDRSFFKRASDGCSGRIPRYQVVIGYCSQKDLPIQGSVRRNVLLERAFDSELSTAAREILLTLLPDGSDFVAFEDFLESGVMNLSGGELQRVCLARVLNRRPDILILDEVTSALDKRMERRVFGILKNHFSGTVICISHSDQVRGLFETTYQVSDGQVFKKN